jgi:predicted O-linked N-acetylglucosamine transferase (SPINDLY family)
VTNPSSLIENQLSPERLLEHGLAYHRQGNYNYAIQVYQELLVLVPTHADAMHLIGEALYRQGQFGAALSYLNNAIANVPHHFYLNTRGMVFLESGHLMEAEQDLRRAIKTVPDYLEAHINLSNVCRQKKDFKHAKRFAALAVKLNPESAAAWNAVGAVDMESARFDEALQAFDRALEMAPDALVTVKNKAKILVAQKKWQDALPLLVQAADLQDFEVYTMLSRAYGVLGQTVNAIDPFQAAMRVSTPDLRKIYFSTSEGVEQLIAMGDALGVYRSNFSAAAELYQLAIESLPEHTTLINNLAVSQFNQSVFDKAVENLRKLLLLDPINVQARTNLGVSLIMQDQSEEAIDEFKLALEHDPQFLAAAGWMIGEKNRICSWDGMLGLRKKVADLLDRPGSKQSVNSFILLSNYDDPAKFLEWSRINSRENFANLGIQSPPAIGVGRKHDRIRVGYFSVDFRNHPVAHLTAPLYGMHDRSKFEVWVYSYGPDDKHPVRQRIQEGAEHFVNLEGQSTQSMVERIRNDEIDILVDLSGNTRGSKIQVLGHRPAPVQVHWLGFIGSMGSQYYDYTIVDSFVAPEGADEYYDEKLLRMPDCFQINDTARPQTLMPLTRAQCGLPEDAFVFADFNQSFKIQPEIFAAWVRILKAVPESVLWLADGHHSYIKNIRAEWAEAGLEDCRLVIAPRVSVDQYLAQYQLVDLFLDVFPYTSGTTASDALWAGCPLLALVGKTMVARMAGSLVKAAGLPQLLTYSVDEYVDRAIFFANNPQEVKSMSKHLIENRLNLPLFDTEKFVTYLEKAYVQMAQMTWSGQDLLAIKLESQ